MANRDPSQSYSTRAIDFDNMILDHVAILCRKAMRHFRLHGFIVFQSSENSYHAVFDCEVSWEKNCRVMSWLAIESKNVKAKDYVLMQIIKRNSTLRIGMKGDKPSPKIVYREGKQDNQIHKFLLNRRFIKDSMRKMLKEELRSYIV